MTKKNKKTYILFFIFLVANTLFWIRSHTILPAWANVPPAPTVTASKMMTLNDRQLAYRMNAVMLQGLGNTDGRVLSLRDYNYANVKDWLFLEDNLDPVSNAVPMLAAYYFGAVKDKQRLNDVLDYLSVVGQRPYGEKWRWLGHGVYLARHEQEDNAKALELAYLLAANQDPKMADWAKQMPAFILRAQGESRLAYDIMLNILVSNVDTLHPNEIFYMKDYICNTLIPEDKTIQPPDFCR